jgi:CheY-specific phosphatase CheX
MNQAMTEQARARPDATWEGIIVNAAREVFDLMVATDVQTIPKPEALSAKVSAMVGLAGSLCAVLRVRCSNTAAKSIATKMLGGQEITDHAAYDAVGELCNMIAGNFKAKITSLATACSLSVPTVVVGEDYDLFPLGGHERFEVFLEYDGEPLSVVLDVS